MELLVQSIKSMQFTVSQINPSGVTCDTENLPTRLLKCSYWMFQMNLNI